jgi:hypothetical protein
MIEIIYLSFIIIVNNFQLIKSHSLHDQRLTHRQLQAQNCEVAPGINYEYVYVKGNNVSKGTILFLHSFPSS